MGGGGGKGWFDGTKGSRKPQVRQGLQNKHVKGTNNYKQEIAKGNHPSILEADPQQLLDSFAGKGVKPTAESNKEWVDFGLVIGQYYNTTTKQYVDTTKGFIHYDSRGQAHIVPSNPTGAW